MNKSNSLLEKTKGLLPYILVGAGITSIIGMQNYFSRQELIGVIKSINEADGVAAKELATCLGGDTPKKDWSLRTSDFADKNEIILITSGKDCEYRFKNGIVGRTLSARISDDGESIIVLLDDRQIYETSASDLVGPTISIRGDEVWLSSTAG